MPHPESDWDDEIASTAAMVRALLDSAVSGVYVYDLDRGSNVYVSPRYTELTGYRREELDALSGEAFLELFHPDDRAAVLDHMAEVATAAPGQPIPLQYRFRHREGHWVWLYGVDVPLTEAPTRQFMVSFVDISRQQHVSEEIEMFAHLAAHDLIAPSRPIQLLLEMLQGSDAWEGLDSESRELVDQVASEAGRLERYILDMRALTDVASHRQPERTDVDLAQVVSEVTRTLRVEIETASATLEIAPLPVVRGSPSLLEALYRNLISNALRHAASGVHIVLAHEPGSPQFEVRNDRARERPSFRSGLEPGRGSARRRGLGLAICRRIVDHHGGRIRIGAEGEVVSVRFTLGPLVQER